jgi:hypothetical protein
MKHRYKQQLKIIDNFLESPSLWRSLALTQEYQKDSSGYPGFKSRPLDELYPEIFHSLAGKIIDHVTSYKNRFDRLKIQFAYSTSVNQHGVMHQDEPIYNVAGLIYLSEFAPLGSGTLFYNYIDGRLQPTLTVENVYNRFIIFDPKVWHSPADLFGDNLENSRLTLTFFGIAS